MKASITEDVKAKKLHYVWSDSANFSKQDMDAKTVGKALTKIKAKLGYLDPKEVVEEARSKISPLHRFFTWDNSIAAGKFRLQEADKLIRSVCVIYEEAKETGKKNIKAFIAEPSLARKAGKDLKIIEIK